MDVLNNVNTIISIVVGIFGIGGYIVGITSYLRHKAASSQQKQINQVISSQKQPVHQIMTKRLSMLDWLEAFLFGIGDCMKAWNGGGIFTSFMVGLIGIIFIGTFASVYNSYLPLVLFLVPYLTFNLLFYVYFVGRRIEKKTEEINKPLMQMQKHPRTR